MVRERAGAERHGPAPEGRSEGHLGVPAGAATADVLHLQVVGAPPARGGLVFRRARSVEPDQGPRDVSLLIATLIGASNRFERQVDAVKFLEGCRADEGEQADLIHQCVDVVNLAIRAYRAAARDPFVSEIEAGDAREVRIGYGESDELTRGGWTEAFTPPPPRAPRVPRSKRLRPTEVVALTIGGRLPLLDAEEMALRTMLDLEHGRPRTAALQLRACLEMLVAELTDAGEFFRPPRDELERRVPEAEELAQLALDNRLDEDRVADVREILDRVEDALEDWRTWHSEY